uniref:GDNF/GAS1 domain-containing protein n=1 Tax=Lepisosteus oculatus TaxID=7918 RepID=W5NJU6_LEPOC
MAKEKCASDSSACRSAWDLLINVCNATGESCRINLSHRCNMTVQYMMNSYPELKGCLSMEDVSCSILRLIAPQCTDRSAVKPEKDPKRLWESSALAKHAYGRKGSCLDVTRLCLQDEICNRQMVPHIQACSGNPNHCNATHCQRAVQLFYDQMPYSVAVMLAFCDCSPTDDQCLQVKDVLHSRFCSEQQGTSPTCLEVLDRCLEETSCRHRYEVFHSKCWGGGRAVCRGHAGDGCESHMHEEMMRTDDN